MAVFLYLNQAITGLGAKDDYVEVDDAQGEQMVASGFADPAHDEPAEAPEDRHLVRPDGWALVGEQGPEPTPSEGPHTPGVGEPGGELPEPEGEPQGELAPGEDPDAADPFAGDAPEPVDDTPPEPDAERRFQAAWADAHHVAYPKSATGERIAELIAEHLAEQDSE